MGLGAARRPRSVDDPRLEGLAHCCTARQFDGDISRNTIRSEAHHLRHRSDVGGRCLVDSASLSDRDARFGDVRASGLLPRWEQTQRFIEMRGT